MDANQKLLDFIMDCGVFYYATVDNGKARVRPFGFATILDGKLYFGMGDHKRSYRETVENPYVEICACKGGEWIRIRGKAVFDFDANERIFQENEFLRNKYGPGTPLTHAAFYLEEMEADYNTMADTCEKWV